MANRERGYIDWHPRQKTINLIDKVSRILEAEKEYLPLTIRQVFYRLVAANAIGKTEKDYARLCETLNKARRSRMISFQDIRDDGFSQFNWPGYRDFGEWVDDTIIHARTFELDKQGDQNIRLVVWCEAGGMVPQLKSFVSETSVPVVSSGGFDSLSTKYTMARELSKVAVNGQDIVVLHIGDYDPSGVTIFTALAEDVQAFARDSFNADVTFKRIAVTPEQIDRLGLPTAPPKTTDKRSGFTDNRTTQCEAIPPAELKRIVLAEIGAHWDHQAFDRMLAEQKEARESGVKMMLALTQQKYD